MSKRLLLMFMLFIILIGCGLKTPSMVPPYTLGIKIDISTLKRDYAHYDLYYAEPVYNPPAILFLKKHINEKITLSKFFKKIKNPDLFKELMSRIEYIKPDLYALIIKDENACHVVGYIYTVGHTYLKKIGSNEYFLLPVSEHFNDIYYGGDDAFSHGNFD